MKRREVARSEADKTGGGVKWREIALSESDKTGGGVKWREGRGRRTPPLREPAPKAGRRFSRSRPG